MKIAVIGYATEGKVSYEYYKQRGHDITICDENASVITPEGVATQLGDEWDKNLDNFDIIVRTAGLKPSKILKNNPTVGNKITTAVNEFLLNCPTKNTIGITGTKGKGTTSTLAANFLKQAGYTVWLGGNIGKSPLEFIDQIQPEDYVVLELSSFQLMDLRTSPHTAVCVLMEPEHLDWHADLEEYIAAKQQLFRHQSADDMAVYFNESQLSQKVASVSAGRKLSYFDKDLAHISDDKLMLGDDVICKVEDILLPGRHNLQNICAALTAVHDKIDNRAVFKQVVTTLEALPYRIQPIAKKNNVTFYNDSYSSTPTATMAAIAAVAGQKIMIIGGKDKNNPVDELTKTIAQNASSIKHVIVIGELSAKIASGLESNGFTTYTNLGLSTDMKLIVAKANELAEPGDAIILSPGSSSFDMFKNFQDRGDQFNQAVNDL